MVKSLNKFESGCILMHRQISGWHEDLRPFWTIQDPALWREDGDLMSGNSSSAELRLARAQLLWPKCGTL